MVRVRPTSLLGKDFRKHLISTFRTSSLSTKPRFFRPTHRKNNRSTTTSNSMHTIGETFSTRRRFIHRHSLSNRNRRIIVEVSGDTTIDFHMFVNNNNHLIVTIPVRRSLRVPATITTRFHLLRFQHKTQRRGNNVTIRRSNYRHRTLNIVTNKDHRGTLIANFLTRYNRTIRHTTPLVNPSKPRVLSLNMCQNLSTQRVRSLREDQLTGNMSTLTNLRCFHKGAIQGCTRSYGTNSRSARIRPLFPMGHSQKNNLFSKVRIF